MTGWQTIDAEELVRALDGERFDGIPRTAGIYLWRRNYRAPSQCSSDGDACLNWVRRLATQPSGTLARKPLAHCVWSEGLQIGGGGLPGAKAKTLESIAANPKSRRALLSFIESLSAYALVMYIGQADDLRARIKQHLLKGTELYPYIEKLGLAWQDLELSYKALTSGEGLSDKARECQELFELIAQRTLAPLGTVRPG